MHLHLLILGLGLGLQGRVTLGLSLPEELPSPSKISKRFITEPRSSHLNWNAPRVGPSHFLAKRTNLHSVEYFNNPPASLRRRLNPDPDPDLESEVNNTNPATLLSSRATSGRWESLSGSFASNYKYHPAPVSWGKGRLDLCYTHKDKTCQHRYRDNSYPDKGWSNKWYDLGGELDSAPSTCSRKKDNMHVFCKGTDGQAWHKSYSHDSKKQTGTWGNWQAMGGNMKGYPSSCSWGEKHVSVYVSSYDGQCWHRRYDEDYGNNKGWYGWENLGGYLAGPPKSVTWGKDHTSVFCKGEDGQAWHRQYGGKEGKSPAWGDWEPLGGSLDSEPAACAWGGRMDMFVKGSDGACWWKTYKDWGKGKGSTPTPPKGNQTSTAKVPPQPSTTAKPPTTTPPATTLPKWGEWENLGGDMKDGVAPEVVEVDGNMEVYITGKDDQLYRKTWDSETDEWSEGWEAMGGNMDSKPSAVMWDEGKVDVYGKGSDGTCKRCYT